MSSDSTTVLSSMHEDHDFIGTSVKMGTIVRFAGDLMALSCERKVLCVQNRKEERRFHRIKTLRLSLQSWRGGIWSAMDADILLFTWLHCGYLM